MIVRRRRGGVHLVLRSLFAVSVVTACSTGLLPVGDDRQAAVDANAPDGDTSDGSTEDADAQPDTAKADAVPLVSCSQNLGKCTQATVACETKLAGSDCTGATPRCCLVDCPQLTPPSPTLCDGGPLAVRYDPAGCPAGAACAPADCATTGGACVPDVASCGGKIGPSATYVCASGVCCLPQ